MHARDRYLHFAELAAHEQAGVDFEILVVPRRSRLAILAPHGGGIEPGTSELAAALAGERLSLYVFDGRKRGGSRGLHLTSTRFDEPRCLALLEQTAVAITLHGCAGAEQAVYTGGLDRALQERVTAHLSAAGFRARPDRPARSGAHPQNLCNRGTSGRGLQLELSEGLRRQFFAALNRPGRRIRTPVFTRFVEALQSALFEDLLL